MREQVINQRTSGRVASAGGRARSGAMVQRPVKRERGSTARSGDSGLRKFVSLLPLIGKVLLAVAIGLLVFAGYRAAASASFFQARTLDISGASRANADEVKSVLRRGVAQTGVWRADLSELSAELERLPWVRLAIVSRVLPDGLRVRITERTPRAVVRTSAGKFIWVDEDAVGLGALSPSDRMPSFFIRGWDEGGSDAARAENRERVQKYLEMSREWEAANLGKRVSEVNVSDLRDVRVQLAGDDSQIEVRLGERDFTDRLKRALAVLDEERNTPRGPFITYLMALDKRTIIGTSSGAQIPGDNTANASSESENKAVRASAPRMETVKLSNRKKDKADEAGRKQNNPRRTDNQEKKNRSADHENSQTRPRRVG